MNDKKKKYKYLLMMVLIERFNSTFYQRILRLLFEVYIEKHFNNNRQHLLLRLLFFIFSLFIVVGTSVVFILNFRTK